MNPMGDNTGSYENLPSIELPPVTIVGSTETIGDAGAENLMNSIELAFTDPVMAGVGLVILLNDIPGPSNRINIYDGTYDPRNWQANPTGN